MKDLRVSPVASIVERLDLWTGHVLVAQRASPLNGDFDTCIEVTLDSGMRVMRSVRIIRNLSIQKLTSRLTSSRSCSMRLVMDRRYSWRLLNLLLMLLLLLLLLTIVVHWWSTLTICLSLGLIVLIHVDPRNDRLSPLSWLSWSSSSAQHQRWVTSFTC